MISFEAKEFIKEQLKELLNKIENNNFYIVDLRNPSLSIWCFYLEFENSITSKFPVNEIKAEKIKMLEDIFEGLEFDKFHIDARKGLEETKKEIHDYCERIKGNLKLTY